MKGEGERLRWMHGARQVGERGKRAGGGRRKNPPRGVSTLLCTKSAPNKRVEKQQNGGGGIVILHYGSGRIQVSLEGNGIPREP